MWTKSLEMMPTETRTGKNDARAAGSKRADAGRRETGKSRIFSSVWRTYYLALSTVLGVPVAEAEGALPGGLDGPARAVALALRSVDKRERALALARPLAAVARAVDATRLT